MSGTPRRKPGRMGAHIEPFRERLLAAGYTPGTVRGLLMVMGQLGRWMQADLADGEQLTDQHIEVFVESLRSRGDSAFRGCGALIRWWRICGTRGFWNRARLNRSRRSKRWWSGSGRG